MHQAEAKEEVILNERGQGSMSQILENHLSELTIVKLTVKKQELGFI